MTAPQNPQPPTNPLPVPNPQPTPTSSQTTGAESIYDNANDEASEKDPLLEAVNETRVEDDKFKEEYAKQESEAVTEPTVSETIVTNPAATVPSQGADQTTVPATNPA